MLLSASEMQPVPDDDNRMENSENSVNSTKVTMTQDALSRVKVSPLLTQVAGHQYRKDKKMGILSLGTHLVLKALQNPPRGTRELEFYEEVFSPACTDEDVLALRRFIPTYHGTLDMDSARFLKLENVAANHRRPCVADLKMGKITYDPYATPEKIKEQSSKCPSAALLGFQVSGMMVYNVETDCYDRMDKVEGHKLTTDNMLSDGIGKFFGHPQCLRKDAVRNVLTKLVEIEKWFCKQRVYCFYASSLLVVYEGCLKHENQIECSCSTASYDASCNEVDTPNCDIPLVSSSRSSAVHLSTDVGVKIIDFAHVFPSTEMDNNYVDGLRNLIQHLRQLLELDQTDRVSDS